MLYEYTFKIQQNEVDNILDKLNQAGLYNTYYEQPIEIEKVQNGYDYTFALEKLIDFKIYVQENDSVKHIEQISELLGLDLDSIQVTTIKDDDWSYTLEDIDLGNGWIIRQSNSENECPNKKILRFDHQAAFGSGLHATTQGCLNYILDQDFTNQCVLDLGTGSGILTIAASLRNAKEVTAIDYEPVEREVMHNVKLNELSNKITVKQEDLIHGDYRINSNFDWIFINIGAKETMAIVHRHSLLEKSNKFIISGLVEWYLDDIINTFTKNDFNIEKKTQLKEWVTIVFKK